jgi:hypothetical protein
VLTALSWLGLAAELLCAPLAAWKVTRPVAWLALAAMHVTILLTMRTTMLSLGALLPLVFAFDHRWGASASRLRDPPARHPASR